MKRLEEPGFPYMTEPDPRGYLATETMLNKIILLLLLSLFFN